jgi:hypothetical protein
MKTEIMVESDWIERTVNLAAREKGRKRGSETEPLGIVCVIERLDS